MPELEYSYRRLVNIVGPQRVSRARFERYLYSHDFSALPKQAYFTFKLDPDFVVLPKNAEEVSRIVKFSHEAGLSVVPRGGGTGMFGGSVPNRGGILLDLRFMARVLLADSESHLLSTEAGATWQDVAKKAASTGLFMPVQPYFGQASTVGGGLAAGVTGIGAYKYGSPSNFVVDMEVILPDGSIVHTGNGDIETGSGYGNLKGALLGGEGTTGVITQVTFSLPAKPEEVREASYSFPDLPEIGDGLRELVSADIAPLHVDFLDPDHLVFQSLISPSLPRPSGIASVILDGARDELNEEEKILDSLMSSSGGKKLNAESTQWIQSHRTKMLSARRISGGLVISEGVIPLKNYKEAVDKTREISDRLLMNIAINGYLADRNSVVLRPYYLTNDRSFKSQLSLGFVKRFRDLTFDVGGHPHGLGLLMVYDLQRMHGNASTLIYSVKDVVDPERKLNPGKTTETWTRLSWPLVNVMPPRLVSLGLKILGYGKVLAPGDKYVKSFKTRKEEK